MVPSGQFLEQKKTRIQSLEHEWLATGNKKLLVFIISIVILARSTVDIQLIVCIQLNAFITRRNI
jgi:hypothetical protein